MRTITRQLQRDLTKMDNWRTQMSCALSNILTRGSCLMAAEPFDDLSIIAKNYSFKRILCLNDKDRSASLKKPMETKMQ
ncbi:hypothetical protein MXB_3488 [Myxobolus squamalis]|nr:hypothetical protein MXB_3488 [Myxobolus squamalis]